MSSALAEARSHEDAFPPRQVAVLECALALLVEGGERALTTAALARAANCSKESLYKWFGDRDGLLAGVITHQAGKVGPRQTPVGRVDAAAFRAQLVQFAADLRRVLSGEVSIALNRLAIGQAGSRDLGASSSSTAADRSSGASRGSSRPAGCRATSASTTWRMPPARSTASSSRTCTCASCSATRSPPTSATTAPRRCVPSIVSSASSGRVADPRDPPADGYGARSRTYQQGPGGGRIRKGRPENARLLRSGCRPHLIKGKKVVVVGYGSRAARTR